MHPVAAEPSRHHVTAVLVAHDGARWLSAALDALAAQVRPPDRVVAVDTGSKDDTHDLLAAAVGEDAVLTVSRRTGFGAAVVAGLARANRATPSVDTAPGGRGDGGTHASHRHQTSAAVLDAGHEWVWLLHDDCAPEPGALRSLIEEAEVAPSAGVLGPKVRGWPASRQLIEVGFTVDRVGRRETGLDRGELDQGQHDGVRDVLAVGTAGMLVRREVWDRLGGLDPALPIFGDDLDFCWRARLAGVRVLVVPDAVVCHVAAAATGARPVDAVGGNAPGRAARRHGVYAVMANLPLLALLLVVPRLALGAVLGGVARLALRRPGSAAEVRAVGGVFLHPVRLLRTRWRRRRTRTVPARAAYPLLADPRLRLRRHRDALADWTARLTSPAAARRHRRAGLVAGPDGAPSDAAAGTGLVRALLGRPPVLLGVALVAVALVAEHDLLGTGSLAGGRLLPAPAGVSDLWSAYTASWHPVGAGTSAPAPTYLALLAALAGPLLGRPPLAVDVLLLGCIPLAGLSAYAATRRLTGRVSLRLWAAAAYALLPALTGAVAGGRVDAAAALVALPLVLSGLGAALVADRRAGWRKAWGAALGLSLAAAFSPLLYLLLAPLLLGVVLLAPVVTRGDRWHGARPSLAALIVLAVPPVLLLPWTPTLLAHPGAALAGFGPAARGLIDPGLRPVDVLLLHSGGPGLPPLWLGAPLLGAALAGLARSRGRELALAGWILALAGTAGGVLVARVTAAPLAGGPAAPVWPGVPTALAGAGLLLAAVVAADGLFGRLTGHSFSWRQPVAVALSVAAAGVPVLAAASWVGGGGDTVLKRQDSSVLPAFVTAELAGRNRPRALVLRPAPDGTLRYALLRGAGSRLGDADLAPPRTLPNGLTSLVQDLAAGRGGEVAERLAAAAVGYVYLPPPAPGRLVRALDGVAGLSRVAAAPGVRLWRVLAPTGSLTLLRAAGGPAGAESIRTVPAAGSESTRTVLPAGGPAGSVGTRTVLPAGPPGRLLALAEPADGGWRATLDGRPMPRRTAYGWAQAFAVPDDGGRLVVRHDGSRRRHQLLGQGALLVVLLLLAAPAARRPEDRDDQPAASDTEPLVIDLRDPAPERIEAPAAVRR